MVKTVEFRNRTLIVADPVMEKTLDLASRASRSTLPVLIVGPSGTGKELVARYIHERGSRASGPFVSINCAAIPEGLMEAELFGYERGAFTGAVAQRIGRFERASGGTILLDEISEMPVHLQAKLLRVLQEGEIDRLGGNHAIPVRTRVIATTNVEPIELIRKETFRADLFYRLNVIRIDCSPLAGRSLAIATLAEEILKRSCRAVESSPKRFTEEAQRKLQAYAWPGNIRELQNAIERAVLLCDGPIIGAEQLDLRPLLAGEAGLQTDLSSMEQRAIVSTLEHTQGNRTEAARRLGISVRTLRNKLKEMS